jgi:hypothetical protein
MNSIFSFYYATSYIFCAFNSACLLASYASYNRFYSNISSFSLANLSRRSNSARVIRSYCSSRNFAFAIIASFANRFSSVAILAASLYYSNSSYLSISLLSISCRLNSTSRACYSAIRLVYSAKANAAASLSASFRFISYYLSISSSAAFLAAS